MIEKRKRGRPFGSLSGSIHRSDNNETPHIVTQIRHAPRHEQVIELKHHLTGKIALVDRLACDVFYDKYFNAAKPTDKETLVEEFGVTYFGMTKKTSSKITLYDAVGKAKEKMRNRT